MTGNVVDFAAVRALRIASGQPSPPGEVLDADRIIIEATEVLFKLTEENVRLRKLLEELTDKGHRTIRAICIQMAVGLAFGLIIARLW